MAYDEQLAERVRELLMPDDDRVRELKMFGGLCFTLAGNMAVGLHGDRLIPPLPTHYSRSHTWRRST